MDLFNFYKYSKENHIMLSFKGALSQEILVEMGNLIRNQFSLSKKIKKLFAVFIELSQNIMYYSSEREKIGDKEIGVGILLFIESEKTYDIISGNLMESIKVEKLKQHLDNLKLMNPIELKETYNKQLHNNRGQDSKGAGLGFIDICRKSDGNITYDFSPIDNVYTFFSFIAKIDKEESNG